MRRFNWQIGGLNKSILQNVWLTAFVLTDVVWLQHFIVHTVEKMPTKSTSVSLNLKPFSMRWLHTHSLQFQSVCGWMFKRHEYMFLPGQRLTPPQAATCWSFSDRFWECCVWKKLKWMRKWNVLPANPTWVHWTIRGKIKLIWIFRHFPGISGLHRTDRGDDLPHGLTSVHHVTICYLCDMILLCLLNT